MKRELLYDYLEQQVEKYNRLEFITNDPISIPHLFTDKRDIEIVAFWVAMLAWGQRKTIINKAHQLIELMDHQPYQFITQHQESDLKVFESFKHRTFNSDDTLYFIRFFRRHYSMHQSLEQAFGNSGNVKKRLTTFHNYFFDDILAPHRTRKHVSTPVRKSACKRLNMFLRWMVRKDSKAVDFGLWDSFDMSDLMIPLDIHVFNVATNLGLLTRKKADWLAVEELTSILKEFDPKDPVKYDYALFSLGIDKEVS